MQSKLNLLKIVNSQEFCYRLGIMKLWSIVGEINTGVMEEMIRDKIG